MNCSDGGDAWCWKEGMCGESIEPLRDGCPKDQNRQGKRESLIGSPKIVGGSEEEGRRVSGRSQKNKEDLLFLAVKR